MPKQTIPKRGRPRVRDKTAWFGMKLSPKQRDAIKRRAANEGKSASRYIMDLVERDVLPAPDKKRLSGRELLALPPEEGERLLKNASKKALSDYSEMGALRIFEINDPLIEY